MNYKDGISVNSLQVSMSHFCPALYTKSSSASVWNMQH